MAKSKYRYNPDSLSYDRIRPSYKKRLLVLLTYLSGIFSVAVLLNFLSADSITMRWR